MITAPTFADIRNAAAAIGPALVRTPTRHSRTLSEIAGCAVWLKFENRQFTASFKERGALNRILSLTADEKTRGVCAMSAGNHALARDRADSDRVDKSRLSTHRLVVRRIPDDGNHDE